MSAIDNLIKNSFLPADREKIMREAALDDLITLRAAATECDELKRTVEAQAAQLEQAREIIESGSRIYLGSRNSISEYSERCQDWLAANAPAPEEERTICQCVCECDQLATKEDEHGTKLCEQCYNDYYGIAPQVTS